MRCHSIVLVTGGAGFIGSELTRQLIASGRRVVVLDNLSTGLAANLAGLPADSVRLVRGDVCDRALVESLMREVSVIFHLACVNLRHALVAPRDAHDVNATGTLTMLEAARAAGVPRFVHVSSSEVYGTARTSTIAESHPTMPTTAYGASKLAGEAYARAFFATYGSPVTIVRPFNSFGRRSHHDGTSGEVIPRFMLRALAGEPMVVFGDGRQTRDFTHVTDTARGILLAGTQETTIGETINIGSGREVSMLELARNVATVAGVDDVTIEHATPRPGDIAGQRADVTLARTRLAFEPGVGLLDGLRDVRADLERRGFNSRVMTGVGRRG